MIYRNHRSQVHRHQVSMYLALTHFAARRLSSAGIPDNRITIKPNFVDLPRAADQTFDRSDRFVFVGRLAEEKGVRVLLDAWRGLPNVPLLLVGDGPLRMELEGYVRRNALPVEFAGARPRSDVAMLLRTACAAVVPSLCFEGGVPLTLLEAMATGTPVIASCLGGIPELVTHNVDGLLFEPGNSAELSALVRRLRADRSLQLELARRGVRTVQRVHGRQANLEMLLGIYASVCGAHASPP
jgi:glycosyltransferase involved in cell wall biosynthesis